MIDCERVMGPVATVKESMSSLDRSVCFASSEVRAVVFVLASGCDFQIVAAPRILVSSVDVDVMSFVGLVYLAVGIFDRSRRERLHDALLARIFERVVAVFEEIVPLTVVVDRCEDELFEERDVELVREGEVAFLARVFRTVGGHLSSAAGCRSGSSCPVG